MFLNGITVKIDPPEGVIFIVKPFKNDHLIIKNNVLNGITVKIDPQGGHFHCNTIQKWSFDH